jgi:formate hydrogenlyase subunit 3/multisubunit Na+/H+ antiporter MnhD subunit
MGGGPTAWRAVLFLLISHALAKSAIFLAVGNIMRFGGDDRIIHLDRIAQRLPMTAFAFALAGISIIGLPLSGGFIGKYFLLEAALLQDHWGYIITVLIGGLLSAMYIFKVLNYFFTPYVKSYEPNTIPAVMEWAALILALSAILLGFFTSSVLSIADIGNLFEHHGVKS